MTRVGIAYVSGNYIADAVAPISGANLMSGSKAISSHLSSSIIKVYMSPTFATDYTLSNFGSPTTLTTLAQSIEYTKLFTSASFDTYFINTWTFANGTNNPWRFGINSSMLENEKNEIKALAVHLLQTYQNTGKTFVLQNWEGDWSLIGEFDPASNIPSRRPDWMAAFLRARHQGIKEAREQVGQNNVKVLHAVEANRIVDCLNQTHVARIVNDVLPKIEIDYVSWSAYDGTTLDYGNNESDMMSIIEDLMIRCSKAIRKAAPNTPIYMGEFGFAEYELPAGYDAGRLVQKVFDMCQELNFDYMLHWQVYDNASSGTGPNGSRGFWCINQTGSLTPTGHRIKGLILSGSG